MKVINFIKANSAWRDILSKEPYNLTINDDSGFTILKYSQFNSDFNNEIVRECRGLIIDQSLNPVCIPFFKFGNFGEPYTDIIDWTTAKIEEKIDGSLIKVWNYDKRWIVSTNGTIFAKKAVIGSERKDKSGNKFKNYAELFYAASKIAGLNIESLNPLYTYMFELVSPYNRIVVPYDFIMLYHIGTRDNVSLKELDIDIGISRPKTYSCKNLEEVIEMASKLGYCEEGYVVKDSLYKRIKVKSPAWISVYHLVNGMNEKKLLEIIRHNELDEFLTYFPEYKSYTDELIKKINRIADYINDIIQSKVNGIHFEARKDFASLALSTKYPSFFFGYYDRKYKTSNEWIWSLTNDKILEQLDKLDNYM